MTIARDFIYRRLAFLGVALCLLQTGCVGVQAQSRELSSAELQRVVQEAHARYEDLQDGANADYIPILTTVLIFICLLWIKI